jgi:uncharacterized small protein (DUF1192 family)
MTTARDVGYSHGEERAMDEEPVRKPKAHELGADLTLLSVDELKERIAALQAEIARLEGAMRGKEASRSSADTFFKR